MHSIPTERKETSRGEFSSSRPLDFVNEDDNVVDDVKMHLEDGRDCTLRTH